MTKLHSKSKIKEEFPTLEDLAFNKMAVKRDKKKKAFKKYKQNLPAGEAGFPRQNNEEI